MATILCKQSTITPEQEIATSFLRQRNPHRKVDQLIDELLEDCNSPEDIIGESGLFKQLSNV
ncbi:MAG: hypothetical protein F6K16_43080 [Symploca sp. SIO2B6]|nr:hypothetical protein [Symploca sp. SIO2B6]